MIRKVFWQVFCVFMATLSLGLLFVSALMPEFGSVLAVVSLCAVAVLILCGVIWQEVSNW